MPLPLPSDSDSNYIGMKMEGIANTLVRLHHEAASTRDAAGLLPYDIAERSGSTWTKGGVGSILNVNRTTFLYADLPEGVMPRVISKVGKDSNMGCMFDILRERTEVLLRAAP